MGRVCFGHMVRRQNRVARQGVVEASPARESDCADRDGNAPPNKRLCRAQPLRERGGAVGTDRGELDRSPDHQLRPVDAIRALRSGRQAIAPYRPPREKIGGRQSFSRIGPIELKLPPALGGNRARNPSKSASGCPARIKPWQGAQHGRWCPTKGSQARGRSV